MTVATIVKGDFVLVRPFEFPAFVTTQASSNSVLVHELARKSGVGGVTFDAAVIFGDRRVFDGFV